MKQNESFSNTQEDALSVDALSRNTSSLEPVIAFQRLIMHGFCDDIYENCAHFNKLLHHFHSISQKRADFVHQITNNCFFLMSVAMLR